MRYERSEVWACFEVALAQYAVETPIYGRRGEPATPLFVSATVQGVVFTRRCGHRFDEYLLRCVGSTGSRVHVKIAII